MCRLQNITMRDYQDSVDKVIPTCRYASLATQKLRQKKVLDMPPSKSLYQKFWYVRKGLITRNEHVKYKSLTSNGSKLWER